MGTDKETAPVKDPPAARTAPRVPSTNRAKKGGLIAAGLGLLGVELGAPLILAEYLAATTVIELEGMETFKPKPLVAEYIEYFGDRGVQFRAKFGRIASGFLVVRHDKGGFQTDLQWLPMNHPDFHPADSSRQLGIMVQLVDSKPTGWVGIAVGSPVPPSYAVIDPKAKTGDDPELLRVMFGRSYHGPDSFTAHNWENVLDRGELKLQTTHTLTPPDGPALWGLFSLYNQQVNYAANANLSGPGVESTMIAFIRRQPTGLITWRRPIELDKEWKSRHISGQVKLSFVDGSFEARGKLTVTHPRVSGDITVVGTSVERAWKLANTHNPAPDVIPGLEPSSYSDGIALVAWGALKLRVTKGLEAIATFLVDPEGHITSRGVLRAPRELKLLDAKPVQKLLDPGPRWTLADVPLYWGVSGAVTAGVDASVGADLLVSLRDLLVKGVYSTRPKTGTLLDISASLNASFAAWAEADAWLEGAVEVGFDAPDICAFGYCLDLDIDIVSVRVGLKGRGTIAAYADARPQIQFIGSNDPAVEAKYKIAGRFEVGGKFDLSLEPYADVSSIFGGPRFGFGGGKWPIAAGSAAIDFECVIGGDANPAPKFTFTKGDFDPRKFVSSLMGSGAAPRDARDRRKFIDRISKQRMDAKDTPRPPLGPLPDATFELRVPFEIADHPHMLWLVLSDPPKVEVQSQRELLSGRLERAKSAVYVKALNANADRRPLLDEQIKDLETLIEMAKKLEADARLLADDPDQPIGVRPNLAASDLPGLLDLATALAEYGERYRDDDMQGRTLLLPPGDLEPTVVGDEQGVLPGTDTVIKGNVDEMRRWVATLKLLPQNVQEPWADYQRQICGPNEYLAVGGGKKVEADGVDIPDTALVDAKYVGNEARSPYIFGSAYPDFLRIKSDAKIDDEFSRYAAVIEDPLTPPRMLRIFTNHPDAVTFFEARLQQHGILGEVVEEDAR
ncbi:MAG: restriction endonuclease fold toxin-2 domain-containing protein [Kofleriaceae bacterium]